MSIQGYDQWKTASPYDDEPDPLDEIDKFIDRLKNDFVSRPEAIKFLEDLRQNLEDVL